MVPSEKGFAFYSFYFVKFISIFLIWCVFIFPYFVKRLYLAAVWFLRKLGNRKRKQNFETS
jgi:hypothetical protein